MVVENIIYGAVRQLPVPQVNFGQWIHDHLTQRNKDDVIFEDAATGERCTVGELLDRSNQLAKSISAFVKPGKVIAIASANNTPYFTVVLAALYAGVPLALLDPNYTIYELRSILSILKADLTFCSFDQSEKFKKAIAKYRSIRKLVVIDAKERGNFYDTLGEFSDKFSGRPTPEIKHVNVDDHVAFILFSSGTTGLPKGVMLTHSSANATLANLQDPTIKSPLESKLTLAVLPFFHVYGLYIALMSIFDDRKVITMNKFDLDNYLRTIKKHKIAKLVTVPAIIEYLIKNPIVDQYDLSSVCELGCGGAPVSEASIEAIRKKLKLKEVRHGYGLTEAGYGVCLNPVGRGRPGSVGKLYPGLSAVVRDVRTGKNLNSYAEGEICIKGDTVMKGYMENPKETKTAFTSDGWLRTGDIGYYDNDGYFYIVDRLKDVIKYNGLQVAPAELEAILITHPKIKDVGVVGRPDKTAGAGELPTAFVVKQPNASLTENEVKSYLGGFVKRSKHLQGGVIFVDEIPRTTAGKIKRKDLRSLLSEVKSKL